MSWGYKMEKKLKNIYRFLKSNRKYNYSAQAGFYNECITPYHAASKKATSLLFHILNTQSRSRIDKVFVFYKFLEYNKRNLSSFWKFARALGIERDTKTPFKDVFSALKSHKPKWGWGAKTAALFTKSLYHTHRGKYKQFAFWKDVPELKKGDLLYLPVDTVINHLFKKITDKKRISFSTINENLHEEYAGKKMEVWDDLWFWGFITQQTKKEKRTTTAFNEAKYWAQPHFDKRSTTINEIKRKASQFKNLITAKKK